jgi:hypothetical protein
MQACAFGARALRLSAVALGAVCPDGRERGRGERRASLRDFGPAVVGGFEVGSSPSVRLGKAATLLWVLGVSLRERLSLSRLLVSSPAK